MQSRKEQPVDRELLHLLSTKNHIDEKLLEEAFVESETYPTKEKWVLWLERFILGVGISFLLSGIGFFLAYNWTDLHKFAKLGLVQVVLLGLFIPIVLRKKFDYITQLLLVAVVIMIGISFAVFGQIYQTGADAYDLFLVWTLAAIPFTIISRYPALWLIWLALLNITTILWKEQVLGYKYDDIIMFWFFFLNIIPVIVWETGVKKYNWNFTLRWFPRVFIAVALFNITMLIISGMIRRRSHMEHQEYYMVSYLIGAVLYPMIIHIYLKYLKDLIFVSLAVISILVILCTFILRFVDDDLGGVFLTGTLCIAVTIYTVKTLVKINSEWKKHENISQN
ncbi:MAG: DUF2157 domain-containing protein [Raineya sp.]|jgi:uncharacterized membrane protein|nr:DUF2157 domain-containing protein [Raineya sp.]